MKIVLFDTETTGFPRTPIETQPLDVQPRIIQIAAHLVEHDEMGTGFTLIDKLITHINPGVPVPAKITEITGITDTDLAGKPQWGEIREFFFTMCRTAGAVGTHNFEFDARMVHVEERHLNEPKPFAGLMHRCTLQMSRKVNTRAPSHALSNLHQHIFGEPLVGAHTADGDTAGLVRIYMDLVKKGSWRR